MLSKGYRLVKRGSFTYVRTHGVKYSDKYIVLTHVKGRCKRIGFVVSNKIGKAVRRNLVKRRMRGVVRELVPSLANGQMIFVARSGITALSYGELKSRMLTLLGKAGLLNAEKL